jgi:hypothetical protein
MLGLIHASTTPLGSSSTAQLTPEVPNVNVYINTEAVLL